MTRISREMRAEIERETEAVRHASIKITPEMIDRAARAIVYMTAEQWEGVDEPIRRRYCNEAQRALTAAFCSVAPRVGGSAIYCQRCLCELPNHSTSCAEATRLAAENTRLVNMLSTLRDHAFIADEELLQGTVEQIDSLLVELRSAAPRVGGEGRAEGTQDGDREKLAQAIRFVWTWRASDNWAWCVIEDAFNLVPKPTGHPR